MWENRIRAALAGMVILLLCGCAGGALIQEKDGRNTVVRFYSGAVTFTAPDGYCFDPLTTRRDRGFALMVGCERLGFSALWQKDKGGIVTVQVGPKAKVPVKGYENALARLLTQDNLRGVLSGIGKAKVMDVATSPGLVRAYLSGGKAKNKPGVGPEWRAFFDLDGRMVVLSLRGTKDAGISKSRGMAFLQTIVRAQTRQRVAQQGG